MAPTDPVLAARNDGTDTVEWLRWGMIPSWSYENVPRKPLINARIETLVRNGTWRRSLATRRCAIFADGFYEWSGAAAERKPFLVTLQGSEPFAFAGLWDRFHPRTGSPVESCTIVTAPPSSDLARVHDRMPVILSCANLERWLDPELHEAAEALDLLAPPAAGAFEIREVSKRVNAVANDDADLLVPVS